MKNAIKEYCKRNSIWLNAAWGGFMLIAIPVLLSMFGNAGVTGGYLMPAWMQTLCLVGAGFLTGLGAFFTDTVSAFVVLNVSLVFVVVVLLQSIFS